jgi:hypothetical protein
LSNWSVYLTVLHLIGRSKMNERSPSMIPNGMSLDVSITWMLLDVIVSPKNKKKGTTNIILIRLSSVMIDRFFYFGVLAPLSAIFQLYHGDQF